MSNKLSLVLICAVTLLCGCSSLRRPTGSIRQSLLAETPIGTSSADVEAYLRKKKLQWSTYPIASNESIAMGYGDAGMSLENGKVNGQSVQKRYSVELGTYISIPNRYVQATWLFGADDRLVEVWVYKEEAD